MSPESYLYAQVWLTAPSGIEVKLWDRRRANLNIERFRLDTLVGTSPDGRWQLKVTRDDSTGVDGFLTELEFEFAYRW